MTLLSLLNFKRGSWKSVWPCSGGTTTTLGGGNFLRVLSRLCLTFEKGNGSKVPVNKDTVCLFIGISNVIFYTFMTWISSQVIYNTVIDNSVSPVYITCKFGDCGRKPEHEHIDSKPGPPDLRIELRTFWLLGSKSSTNEKHSVSLCGSRIK